MSDPLESDLDLSLSPVKKATAKQGRRARVEEQVRLHLIPATTFTLTTTPRKTRRKPSPWQPLP